MWIENTYYKRELTDRTYVYHRKIMSTNYDYVDISCQDFSI